MNKHIFLLVALLSAGLGWAQNITIKGTVQDTTGVALESATIYLSLVKDSSVVDYTISDKAGNWELKTRPVTQPVFLKISFVSFSDYKEELKSITENREFGVIKLKESKNLLEEIVIEGEVPPIRIKRDTLEFNASSFKVRPDANVEALLKQLPGVQIYSDGKITVNGSEVNEILVNGKSFFGKDGKIALQNLPAEIIDKVQVSETKTEAEKLSGQRATGNQSSINLTIQKDKNKGYFGKFMAGYGSDKRYESSGLINYFKDKQRISLLASSNNVNSTGFSMDEIFDNMGGGRSSVWMAGDGSYSLGGMYIGAGSGITRTNMAGLNYSDEWRKDFDVTASYFVSAATSENRNRSRQETLLPLQEDLSNPGTFIDNNFVTESVSESTREQFSHNISTEFRTKPDSTSTLSFRPKFVKGDMTQSSTSSQVSVDENGEQLNQSNGTNYSDSNNAAFSSTLNYYKTFRNKKRAIGASLNNNNRKDESMNLNRSTTIFYNGNNGNGQPGEPSFDIRDQILNSRQASDSYDGGIEYFEPVTDSLRLRINVDYIWQQNIDDRTGINYDAISQDYTAINQLLTNYLSSSTGTLTPTAGFAVEKSKYNYGADLGTAITTLDSYGTYLGDGYSVRKKYVLPSANANFQYRFTKSKSIYLRYNFNVNFPQARQLLPIEDLSSPLYTSIGNPDLKPSKSHGINGSFRDYNYSTRSGYSIWLNTTFNEDQVVSNTLISESAKRTTTYQNLSGTFNTYVTFNWNKSYKHDAHTFKVSTGISGSYSRQKGFTNGNLYNALSYRVEPNIGLAYDYGELLSVNPTYRLAYNELDYTTYALNATSTVVHRISLQATSYWPKHFMFGNDFQYTYNSNIAPGFKKDFYLWNTSLGYNFREDKMLFKVKVYDVLNRNVGTSRTISATSIRDEENIVLERYVMFSLTYKIGEFGGSSKQSGAGRARGVRP